jgi:hemoglobin
MADTVKLSTRPRPESWSANVAQHAGIDEALIRRVVEAFYAQVQQDALLGPVFASRVTNWSHHLDKLCDFWSSVLLTTGRYKGRPLMMHLPLRIEASHFARWLALFSSTADSLCTPEAARVFRARAESIAQSLQMGIEHAQEPSQ